MVSLTEHICICVCLIEYIFGEVTVNCNYKLILKTKCYVCKPAAIFKCIMMSQGSHVNRDSLMFGGF